MMHREFKWLARGHTGNKWQIDRNREQHWLCHTSLSAAESHALTLSVSTHKPHDAMKDSRHLQRAEM